MTDKINDGGPAFPLMKSSLTRVQQEPRLFTQDYEMIGCMSLRDYFAGQVLAGILAGAETFGPFKDADDIALRSYRMADAMLAARKPLS